MDFFITYIVPILSLIIAVFSGWGNFKVRFLSLRTKSIEKKLSLIQRDLDEIQKVNDDLSYFNAYVFKQIVYFMFVVFVINLYIIVPEMQAYTIVSKIFSATLFYITGYVAGNTIRIVNCVLKKNQLIDKLNIKKSKLESKVKKLKVRTA